MGTTIEGVIKPCKKYCGFRRMVDAWNVRVTQNVPIKGLIVTEHILLKSTRIKEHE